MPINPLDLAQAGPVAILLVFIAVGVAAFVKGTVVPGWLYRQEREQRQKAETQADRNTESLAIVSRFLDARRSTLSGPDERS
jgi:hypothetical protein